MHIYRRAITIRSNVVSESLTIPFVFARGSIRLFHINAPDELTPSPSEYMTLINQERLNTFCMLPRSSINQSSVFDSGENNFSHIVLNQCENKRRTFVVLKMDGLTIPLRNTEKCLRNNLFRYLAYVKLSQGVKRRHRDGITSLKSLRLFRKIYKRGALLRACICVSKRVARGVLLLRRGPRR